MEQFKAKYWEWYNRHFQAGWYASASLIGGWLSAGIAWLPDLLNFLLVDHGQFFVGFAFPTMDPETKAVFLSFYLAFIAPPLRAKIQKWMQKKSVMQQAEAGKVIPLPPSGVPIASVDLDLRTPTQVIAAEALEAEATALENQRQATEPRAW